MKRKIKRAKTKKFSINKEKILEEIRKEVGKKTYQHKYQHYCFECECHPNDDPIELEKEMSERHLDN